jgi:type IV pilus assembly protein PilB
MTNFDISDKIGYTLLSKGIIDFETLEKAIQIRESEDGKIKRNLGQVLVSDFRLDHDLVFNEVANLYAFREIRLHTEDIDDNWIKFIRKFVNGLPENISNLMIKTRVLPLRFDKKQTDKLILIAADPTDRNIPSIARHFGVKKYEICYSRIKDLQHLFDQVMPKKNEFLQMLEKGDVELEDVDHRDEGLNEEELESEINKSALINLIEGVLVEAVRKDASDIHIIPKRGKRTEFHIRIDGNLQLWHVQENTMPEAIAAVVKDRSKNVDRFERETSQDGFIERNIDGNNIRFRVSIIPIVASISSHKHESVVIRVLDDRKVITDIEKLGLTGPAKDNFHKAISQPQGIVILTGPTGSGKSTTLIAALHQVIDPTVNVLTVEDPVEYIIHGARQLKLGHKMSFEQALRGILRHDPDIVLVGEMRDKITAETAIKLANTGHLTFSTLHTNDAPSAVSRLFKMGIEPFLIAYAINIIVAQRLLRTLCNACKKPLKEIEWKPYLKFGFTEEDLKENTIFTPFGCQKCSGGYKGRAAIHEALLFTKEIRQSIINSKSDIDETAIRQIAEKQGMWSLRRSGMERIKRGETSLEEVVATTVED